MITRYGFSDKLGPMVYGQDQGEVFLGRDISQSRNYSETVASEIDDEIRGLIDDAYRTTETILRKHMDQMTIVAEYLMKHEKIDGAVFKALMEGKEIPISEEDKFIPLSKQAQRSSEDDGLYIEIPQSQADLDEAEATETTETAETAEAIPTVEAQEAIEAENIAEASEEEPDNSKENKDKE